LLLAPCSWLLAIRYIRKKDFLRTLAQPAK
jgi:hypothetical protein